MNNWDGVGNSLESVAARKLVRLVADLPEDVERRLMRESVDLGQATKKAWRAGAVDIAVQGGRLLVRRNV